EALTTHPEFRSYVLRHLMHEGFLLSVIEYSNEVDACEGIAYFKHMNEKQRHILRRRLEAWQRASGAGVTESDGINSESAFGELQLAQPVRTFGLVPTLQRRVAVLREVGNAIKEEQRSHCRPYMIRVRAPPPRCASGEHADVHLGLTMNAVAMRSLATIAALIPTLSALGSMTPASHDRGRVLELARAPFRVLAEMLEDFPPLSLFKYWSPMPMEPEKSTPIRLGSATASSAPA
ncbi:unnamed protein product, partial [Choristocarpus tenellus]